MKQKVQKVKRAHKLRKWLKGEVAAASAEHTVLMRIKKNAFASYGHFTKALQARGFEILGSGYYSTVLAHSKSDRVVKVTRDLTDRWIDYIKWGGDLGYSGTFVPKVFSYKVIKPKDTSTAEEPWWHIDKEPFSIAVMERLDKTFSKIDKTKKEALVPDLFAFSAQGNTFATDLLDIVMPGVKEFAESFAKEFKGEEDLHAGNFMFRHGGELVFTDPVSRGNRKVTAERLRESDLSSKKQEPEMALAVC